MVISSVQESINSGLYSFNNFIKNINKFFGKEIIIKREDEDDDNDTQKQKL
jgi:hypothetical protein